jgi:ABC-type uncharacterized transport system auxiliary subunit
MTFVQSKTYAPPTTSHTDKPSTTGTLASLTTPTTTYAMDTDAVTSSPVNQDLQYPQWPLPSKNEPDPATQYFERFSKLSDDERNALQRYNRSGQFGAMLNTTELLKTDPEVRRVLDKLDIQYPRWLLPSKNEPDPATQYFERFSKLSDDERNAFQRYERSGQFGAMPNTTELLKIDPEVRRVLDKLDTQSAYA